MRLGGQGIEHQLDTAADVAGIASASRLPPIANGATSRIVAEGSQVKEAEHGW